jgi:hypothetical protein
MLLAKYLMGGEVDDDPRSVTFGNTTLGGNNYNIFGRLTPYVRAVAMHTTGERKTVKGEENIDDYGGTSRGKELWKLFRSKFHPAAGVASDFFSQERYDGSKFTVKDAAIDMFAPMSMTEVKKGLDQEGMLSLLKRGLPAITGIKVSNEKDFEKKVNIPEHITHNGEKVELSSSQKEEFEKLVTDKLSVWQTNLRNSSEYKSASAVDKDKLDKTIIQAAKNQSEDEMKEKYPDQFPKETHDQKREKKQKEKDLKYLKQKIGIPK